MSLKPKIDAETLVFKVLVFYFSHAASSLNIGGMLIWDDTVWM